MLFVIIPKIVFGIIQYNIDSKYSTLTMSFSYPNEATFYIRTTNYNLHYSTAVKYDISSGGTVSLNKVTSGNLNCIAVLKRGNRNSNGVIKLTFDITNLKRNNKYVANVYNSVTQNIGIIIFIYKLEAASAVREVSCFEVSESDNWKVTWSVPSVTGADTVQYRLLLTTVSSNCVPVLLVQFDVSCRSNSNSNSNSCYTSATSVGSAGKKVCPDAHYAENVSCRSISNNKVFSKIIPGRKLQPFTQYNVAIQLGTEWGWNLPASCKFTTKEKKSGSVSIWSISSYFPGNKLQIVWIPPTTPNGLITRYTLLLKKGSSCLIYWNISCSNCANQNVGSGGSSIIESGCNIKRAKTFQKSNSNAKLTIQSNDNIIKPYTDYIIMIQPGNGWGWGYETHEMFKSGQYKSSRPQLERILSDFPNNKFQLEWSGPTTPNGVMIEYIVVMETIQNNCVYKWILKATIFTTASAGNNENVIGKHCDKDRTLTEPDFQLGNFKITVKSNGNSILPYTRYKVSVQGRNGWGYGDILSINTITDKYTLPKPSILDKELINLMKQIVNKRISIDKRTQTYVTLPLNFYSNRRKLIEYFTIVVCVGKKTAIQKTIINYGTYPFYSKNYKQCQQEKECCYEVVLSQSPSYVTERVVTFNESNNPWNTVQYIIGTGSRCDENKNAVFDGYLCNGPLSPATHYKIYLRSYSKSKFYTVGPITVTTDDLPTSSSSIAVATSVIVVLIIVAVGIGIAYYVYRRRNANNKENFKSENENDYEDCENVHKTNITEFRNYVAKLLQDDKALLSDQFNNIQHYAKDLIQKKIVVNVPYVAVKNRFRNITPYTHNAIQLAGSSNQYDQYINASRICRQSIHWHTDPQSQCTCSNVFIAAQGPCGVDTPRKVSTDGDFWLMIMQNNVDVIVNLTRCAEGTEEKCAQYWPEYVGKNIVIQCFNEQNILVHLESSNSYLHHTQRVLRVSLEGNSQIHRVTQIHVTTWSDHGTIDVDVFLAVYNHFIKIKHSTLPTVVHSSAGVGRTGSFILADVVLNKSKSHLTTDIIQSSLKSLRLCRPYMVENVDQYKFVHNVLLKKLEQNIDQNNYPATASTSEIKIGLEDVYYEVQFSDDK